MSRKAIFLDRDGVLVNNSENYYIWKYDQLQLVDGVNENLKLLTDCGFLLFVVSNQGGISKGNYSKNDVRKLHARMTENFRNQGIEIQEIVFCPHHPEVEKCMCRKPESLLIDKLIAKYRLNQAVSFLIGDSESDMEAAQAAGVQGIKIEPNQNMYPYISFLIK